MVRSFAELGAINHLGAAQLPSKSAVALVTEDLLHLMFPGFYDGDRLEGRELGPAITELLSSLEKALEKEVAKSLPKGGGGESVESKVRSFLGRLPAVRAVLKTDVEAVMTGDPAARNVEEILLAYPGIEAIAVQRMAHELYLLGVPLLPRMMTEWVHSRTGIDIHPGATIGASFFIDHGTGIVIGETTEIGREVRIYHGVTLGARSVSGAETLRGRKRHPTIEDRVTIYPGATILGGETVVGQGSTIGGGVFLTKSVPPEHLVFAEHAALQVIPKSERPKGSEYSI
ncbi:MAG: serine acetyltransferase [Verrucomicrobia bacterium]|nr:serine acetyltransferase [Verrucomicrobiota bacterium]NBR63173.1 serine acetyltransferase [Verrucomicrobiota bacterium]